MTEPETTELASLEGVLPRPMVVNWLSRRLRNHTVNLALLDMVAREQIESLLITSDDTSAYGLPTRERDWLSSWCKLIGAPMSDRVGMYPGADEVSSALIARQINRAAGRTPRVWIDYAIAGGEELIAPYEDRPVRQTVLGQLAACGCVPASSPEEADFVLGVVTPSPRLCDYHPDFLELDRPERTAHYNTFIDRLDGYARYRNQLPIAIADVAYCNGADGLFSELLFAPECPLELGRLAAYGAWNTAGNTIGVVIAQAALSTGNGLTTAHAQRFLVHKVLEDYGYMLRVRTEAQSYALEIWGRSEPRADSTHQQRELCAFIEERLSTVLRELQDLGIGVGLEITPGSVTLPWMRTFELDFELHYHGVDEAMAALDVISEPDKMTATSNRRHGLVSRDARRESVSFETAEAAPTGSRSDQR